MIEYDETTRHALMLLAAGLCMALTAASLTLAYFVTEEV